MRFNSPRSEITFVAGLQLKIDQNGNSSRLKHDIGLLKKLQTVQYMAYIHLNT